MLLSECKPLLVSRKVDGELQLARPPDPVGLHGGLTYDPSPGDPLIDTIRKLDDLTYEVPRSTVERVFAARSTYARAVRAIPSRAKGGIVVYGIRPGSIAAAIGLANGDTIRTVNGNAITSTDDLVDQ